MITRGLLIILVLTIASCNQSQSNLDGQWVNLTAFNNYDDVIYEFKEDIVYTLSADDKLVKRNWEFLNTDLIIESEPMRYKKYSFIQLSPDSLLLNHGNDRSIFVRKSTYSQKFQYLFESTELRNELIETPWIMFVETPDENKKHYVEFLNNGKSLISSYDHNVNGYVFSNVGEWDIVSVDSVVFVKLKNIIKNNLFISNSNDSTLTGVLVPDYYSNQTVTYDKVDLKKYLTSQESNVTDLIKGKWEAVSGGSNKSYLVFYDEFDELVTRTSYNNQLYSDAKDVRISSNGELLLLDSIKNKLKDVIEIISIQDNRLVLGFSNRIEPIEYIKINDYVTEDEFF